jgi:Excalibur calcium-binding domain
MNKTTLLAGAVLALSVMTAPTALADVLPTSGNGDRQCDRATVLEAEARVALNVAKTNEREARRAARLPNSPEGNVITAAEQLVIDPLVGIVARLEVELTKATERKTERCRVTTTPPTPTTTPTETTTVTTTPPPPPVDVDCDDVSDAEAQRLLNADPAEHSELDRDRDGIACDELRPRVVVPSGGVNTGGGPA